MTTKYKILALLAIVAVSFALGRYTVSGTSKTENSSASQEDKTNVNKEQLETHKHTITKEIVKPDGTKEIITDNDETSKKKDVDVGTEKKSETAVSKTEVTKGSSSRLTISALAGTKISFSGPLEPIYGGMISRDLIGPISLGVFGFSSGIAGIGIGVSF